MLGDDFQPPRQWQFDEDGVELATGGLQLVAESLVEGDVRVGHHQAAA